MIKVNGTDHDGLSGATVAELVERLGVPARGRGGHDSNTGSAHPPAAKRSAAVDGDIATGAEGQSHRPLDRAQGRQTPSR